uniref:B box-type domain-containing protein n=1 Tax=Zooxanthella nutricula TaxID=1333877 RepID=A0A6U6NS62_9DINO
MDGELRCPVCREYFADPVMLQCTHHICASHVAQLAERGQLKCPVCSDLTVVPDGGLRLDKALQVVVDVWRERQSEEPLPQNGESSPSHEPPRCGFCEEKPATRRCQQCNGVLCEECEKTSHSKGFFKTHTIVDLVVGQEDYAGRMLCDEHPAEKLSFYCLDCRKPVCPHCLILGSHKGHQQTPMDQAYNTAKDTLQAWVGKLRERCQLAENTLDELHNAELEVKKGAEAQRNVINSELDNLREIIETKRHQLLSKSALEEKQKRVQLQAQVDRAEAVRKDSTGLVSRSKDLLALPSEHAFLVVVLPLIQDMKKCASQPMDGGPLWPCNFRPLSCDGQVRVLGELDLGHPRQPQPQPQAYAGAVSSFVTQAGAGLVPQQVNSDASTMAPNYSVVSGFSPAHATVSFLSQPPQAVPTASPAAAPQQLLGAGGATGQSVYVFRSA